MTTAQRAGRRLVVTALLLSAVVGCAESGGAAEASCAHMVTYGGRSYLGVANIDFAVGERLGTATVPECDDTPNDPGVTVPEGRITAYAVQGTDPAVAIAVGDTPAEATLMKAR
ncbi:hypothetical protein EJ357_29080 [Streptomyces cyaneochromogenes]|uniref:Uncharacterized protein n=1 Tax=Streptomyces cyaneochromogenes TaxID=2496836 RepID=A0A3Q9EQP9_9ACTN|nr:DUF6281 family protein [Streptomyces cyaneochromogenes]AZQ37003.1 hypothetical protein EJ357_29080 [Streptomyces cyaneochromogenes]